MKIFILKNGGRKMHRMSDKQLLELLKKAKHHQISIEFIHLLEEEVIARNLKWNK